MDLREGSRPPPLWAYGSEEEEEDHLLGEDPRRTKPVRQLYDATQTPASPPPPDLPAIATLVPEARLRASPCYSTSEEEDVPAFITGSPAHEYSTSEDEDHAALVGPAARAKVKKAPPLRRRPRRLAAAKRRSVKFAESLVVSPRKKPPTPPARSGSPVPPGDGPVSPVAYDPPPSWVKPTFTVLPHSDYGVVLTGSSTA